MEQDRVVGPEGNRVSSIDLNYQGTKILRITGGELFCGFNFRGREPLPHRTYKFFVEKKIGKD